MGHNRNLADYAHHFDGTHIDLGSGNIETQGVLTYEDVTNVDAIGIVTARAGVKVPDNQKIFLGTSDDLWIFHDGGNSWVKDVGTGTLYIDSNGSGVIFSKNTAAEKTAAFYTDGAVELYYDNSKKLETTTTGAKVTGAVEVTQEYPSIRPTLDLNFAATKTLDRRITFTRDSFGTYTDDMGILKYASNNVPRFDHDPTTGESLGLLIEESRTNQMIYSSDITDNGSQNTSYGIQNGTVTGDATTAPDGTTTADKYAANSTNGIHRVDLFFTSGQISNSTVYSFSVFVKANGYDKLHIRYGGYNADNHGLGYDLSDGTTFAGKFDGTSSLGAVTSSSMIAYPNGWYRCSFTFTTAGDAASGAAGIFYYISNSEATTNFAGDGSSGMYFWGAQMEVGSFPTSYIPTSGSTVTRDDDDAVIKGTDFTDFYNETEGTLFAEFNTEATSGNVSKWVMSMRQPDNNNNYIAMTTYNTTKQPITINNNGSSQAGITGGGNVVAGVFTRMVGSYKLNDVDAAVDGTLLTPDTNATMPTGLTQMDIGRGWTNSDQKLEGRIKSIKYYNKKLPDAQLQGLTQQ